MYRDANLRAPHRPSACVLLVAGLLLAAPNAVHADGDLVGKRGLVRRPVTSQAAAPSRDPGRDVVVIDDPVPPRRRGPRERVVVEPSATAEAAAPAQGSWFARLLGGWVVFAIR